MNVPVCISLQTLWRSFFIQGAWNFKGMQNIGFLYALLPGLKLFHPTGVDEATRRYARFFNTQPYMAPTILGVFLNLESQRRPEIAESIQSSLSGSLAAIGDTFFWGTLKPLVALLFLLFFLVDQAWGILLGLIGYNIAHLWVMWWGFTRGCAEGPQGALRLGKLLSVDLSKRISLLIPLLAGIVLSGLAFSSEIGYGLFAGIVLFVAALIALKMRVPVLWLFYGVFTLSVIWAMIR
ncbi:MAG: PTS system mannose/fructose/sorbose family transporter subunit IID [Desulfomonilia bacterium]